MDTTPFQDDYFTDPGEHTYDWSGVLPRQAYLSELLKVGYFFKIAPMTNKKYYEFHKLFKNTFIYGYFRMQFLKVNSAD